MAQNPPVKNSEDFSDYLFEDMQKNQDSDYRRSFIVVAIILLIIFLIPVFAIFAFGGKGLDFHKFLPQKANLANLSALVTEGTKEKKIGEKFDVKITETQLGQSLDLKNTNFPIKKPSLKISPDKIILSGRAGASALSLSVNVGLSPVIESNHIKLEITSIESLGVVAPKEIVDIIRPALEPILNNIYTAPANINLTTVTLYQGHLIITGQVK